MSILVDSESRVVVQGITGKEGTFHTQNCLEYGTRVVAGVTPGKGGESVHGIHVFDTLTSTRLTELPVATGKPPSDLVVGREVTPGEARGLEVDGFDAETGRLTIRYEQACGAINHTIVYGPLADVGEYGYIHVVFRKEKKSGGRDHLEEGRVPGQGPLCQAPFGEAFAGRDCAGKVFLLDGFAVHAVSLGDLPEVGRCE